VLDQVKVRVDPRKTTEVGIDFFAPSEDPLRRARTQEPALITVQGDLPGHVFRLRAGRQLIGRRPECDVRLRERAVSGIHAEVIRVDDVVTIRDLESTNGTLVNGSRLRGPTVLNHGNLVKMGNCVFKFVDSLLDVEFTERLHEQGITDQLTGAFNKAYLVARLAFALDTASERRPLSLITFDFDNFKQINDQYGHAAGDHVLRASSAMLRERCIRAGDIFARMGGEEFVIVLPETNAEAASRLAEQVRQCLEETTFEFEEAQIHLTASFGVCSASSPLAHPDALLARADELLYRSKNEGRNRVTA
jgi:diguanylate cyclase (GGDEF)-like protein